MLLWLEWYRCVRELRQACSRNRTFLWMCLVLVGFSIRTELFGVTSFVRSCFLRPEKYRRLLHLFHTTSLNLDKLSDLWCRMAGRLFSPVLCQGYRVFIADGLKDGSNEKGGYKPKDYAPVNEPLIVKRPLSGTCQPPRSTASFPFRNTHTSSSPVKSSVASVAASYLNQ